jgi:hypothetical protein
MVFSSLNKFFGGIHRSLRSQSELSSKCLVWPNAIRLNGNDPIAVMLDGPVDARMAAVGKLIPFLDGLVMVSVLFVMMNSRLGVEALWCITQEASRAILLGVARSC